MSQFKLIVFLFLGLIPLYLLAQTPDELKARLATETGIEKLSVLHDLTATYRKISIDSSILYGKQAIEVAQKLNNDSLLAQAYLKLCASYYFQGYPDSVIFFARKSEKIGTTLNSNEIIGYAYQLIGSGYSRMGDVTQSIAYHVKSLDVYTAMNDDIGIGAINNNLSKTYTNLGDYNKALEYGLAANKIAERTQRTTSRGLSILNIATIYQQMGQKEKFLTYVQKAKLIFTKDSFPRRHAGVLTYLGNHFLETEQLDSAIYYFSETLKIHQNLGDLNAIAVAHGNLGAIYQENKDWKQSYFHLQRSMQLKKELKDLFALTFDIYNLGAHFELQNKIDSAEYYFLKSLDMAKEHQASTIEENALDQLYLLYEKSKQYEKALDYHKQYVEHINETKGLEVEKAIAELETKYETEKKEREIERLELLSKIEVSKANTLQIGLLALAALATVVIFGLLYRRRNERKVNALKQQVHEKEKEKLDKELNFKTRQLTSHALHMVQKNKVLQELKQGISEISKSSDTTNKKALRALIRRIDFNIQSDEDWNTFKLYFEQTNQNFYENLARINNELTSTELKLCSLIKLNMNIKETASVLNIEPTSVKTARHRLRKKLKLEQGQDLTSFIRQVA